MKSLCIALIFLFTSAAFGQTCLETAREVVPQMSETTRQDFETKLAEARKNVETEASADHLIWLGRRTAYLGDYKDAIKIYTKAINSFPRDGRLYRHRGHRFITLRCFDLAIADFAQAAKLIKGRPDEIEPDGMPNARNIPTSTLQSNIWYHLGLAHYLNGNFNEALKAYREAEKVSTNPDMLVATTHWLYMTLRRLGREKEAGVVVAKIKPDLQVIENGDYYKLIRLYQGTIKPEDLLKEITGNANSLSNASIGYGLGNWFLYNRQPGGEAERIFRQIVAGNQWASFGYIVAEAELKRLNIAGQASGVKSLILGNPVDAKPAKTISPGLVLMGGGTDVDAAFKWMCERAGGGDFVVIRTSGTEAYNPYIQKLCPQMDSVETIIITTKNDANTDYIQRRIRAAEALWIAGGDQSKYVDLWRGTSLQTAVNYLLNSKSVPVGGTSAGLAVLSEFIYTGANGSATSKQTLPDPFNDRVTLDRSLFKSSIGENKIYDSHFVTRDRMGRSLAFLARIVNSGWSKQPRGIGIDDKTAILVTRNGASTIVGAGAAYFLQSRGPAEVISARTPLTYLNIGVYKVGKGGTFNFSTWTGTGGVEYSLSVNNGAVTSTQAGGSLY